MYIKDKKKQIVVRISDEQYNFLKSIADKQGCNISDLVRGFIDFFVVKWSDLGADK